MMESVDWASLKPLRRRDLQLFHTARGAKIEGTVAAPISCMVRFVFCIGVFFYFLENVFRERACTRFWRPRCMTPVISSLSRRSLPYRTGRLSACYQR